MSRSETCQANQPGWADADTLARLRYTPGTSAFSRRAEASAGVRQLEPCYGPPAVPEPAPPRGKAGNGMEPPAVFRVAAGGARLRHPWPAPVGDHNPDNAVLGPDRDRDRLPGSTRAAMPDTVDERPVHQQRTDARGLAAPPRTRGPAAPAPPAPQASRSPGPPAQPSTHPPSRPPSSRKIARAGERTYRDGRPTRGQTSSQGTPGTGTGTPSSGYPHRSLAPIPVRHASVDTAT